MNKKKNYAKLEKKVNELEKRVAALEGSVQVQQKGITISPSVIIDKNVNQEELVNSFNFFSKRDTKNLISK